MGTLLTVIPIPGFVPDDPTPEQAKESILRVLGICVQCHSVSVLVYQSWRCKRCRNSFYNQRFNES